MQTQIHAIGDDDYGRPSWMVEFIDREAKRLGVTRQSVIKMWLAERLDHTNAPIR